MVHSRDSVVPLDRTLIFSQFGHTAETHGKIRDSRLASVLARFSPSPVTSTDA